jgi:nitrogen regulatory protein PII
MPNMIVVVMSDLGKCKDVLDAWEKFGVTGVTIVESLGLQKVKQMHARRDDLPLMPSLRSLIESEEYHHRTAFAVVEDDFDVDGLVAATERAVGSFDAPNSGILFVVPVTRALGMRPHWKK